MTVRSPASWIQASSHPAENDRNMLAALVVAPGVARSADLAVTATGTPDMNVHVAAGAAFVKGTETTYQGMYHVFNDASVSLAIAASDPTNPRIDIVVAQIRDAFYSTASNDFRLVVVTGTPAGAPVAPTTPVNSIVLAQVAVAHSVTSILTGNITDWRWPSEPKVRVLAPGGQSIPSAAITQVTGLSPTAVGAFDLQGNWSVSQNYAVQITGYYSISGTVQMSGSPGGAASYFDCLGYINGALVLRGSRFSLLTTTLDPLSILSDTVHLTAGDVVDLRVEQNSGSAYVVARASLALCFQSS